MVDVLSQVGAVPCELRIDEVDGEKSHVQSLEQAYPSPIDDVWDAVSSPERIQRWFLPVSGDFRVGGRFQFEGQAGGEVLKCEPPVDDAARVVVTWKYGGGVTWLTVALASEGEGTRLRLEHVARASGAEPDVAERAGDATYGFHTGPA